MCSNLKYCLGCVYPIKLNDDGECVCDCPLWDYLMGEVAFVNQSNPESSFIGAKKTPKKDPNTQDLEYPELTSKTLLELSEETKKAISSNLKNDNGDS